MNYGYDPLNIKKNMDRLGGSPPSLEVEAEFALSQWKRKERKMENREEETYPPPEDLHGYGYREKINRDIDAQHQERERELAEKERAQVDSAIGEIMDLVTNGNPSGISERLEKFILRERKKATDLAAEAMGCVSSDELDDTEPASIDSFLSNNESDAALTKAFNQMQDRMDAMARKLKTLEESKTVSSGDKSIDAIRKDRDDLLMDALAFRKIRKIVSEFGVIDT